MALDCHCTSLVPRPSFYRYFAFNSGILSRDDFPLIAHELASSWKMVGRVLNVPDAEINIIEANEFKVDEKCYGKYICVVCTVIMG